MTRFDRFLIEVEEVATITGRGVVTEPEIPLDRLPDEFELPIQVEVRTEEGSGARFEASVDIARRPRPSDVEPGWTLMLHDAQPGEVPVGAEIWLISD